MSDDNLMWHETQTRCREDRVVVKLHDNNGNFKESVIVPTVYWPLNGEYETFHYRNTGMVSDDGVLKAFDSVKMKIGHCYENTEKLVNALVREGYDAKSYAGWLFTSDSEYPVHHCWCVLGNSVLDLGDDFWVMFSAENGKNFSEAKSKEDHIRLIASFQKEAKKQPNSVRCHPVGIPTPFLLYVGCECEPNEARRQYQQLMKEFPDHKNARNRNAEGRNQTQSMLKAMGVE